MIDTIVTLATVLLAVVFISRLDRSRKQRRSDGTDTGSSWGYHSGGSDCDSDGGGGGCDGGGGGGGD